MSTITPDDVVDRLDELAAVANGGTTAPPFDSIEARPPDAPRRRRSALLVAAAVLAVAVIGGVLLAVDRDPKVTTTAQDPTDTGARLVPETWPAGIDGGIAAKLTEVDPGYRSLPSYLLVRDGRATATARLIGFPIPRGYRAASGESYVVDGRFPALTNAYDRTTWVAVEFEPGRTLLLSSSVVGRDELDALAGTFDADAEQFGALPSGWEAERDHLGLASMHGSALLAETGFFGGYPDVGPGWSSVHRRSAEGSRAITVASRQVPDAARMVSRIAELDPDSTSVADLGDGGFARDVDDLDPTFSGGGHTVTAMWAPSADVLAVAIGENVTVDELTTTARASRELTTDEWAEIVDPPALRSAEGFREPEGRLSSVVAEGDGDGFRWRITREPGPYDATITTLGVLFDEGDEAISGWAPPPRFAGADIDALEGLMSGRTERHVTVMVGGPLGLRDALININGIEAPAISVDVPEAGGAVVFATLPPRSTPDLQVSPTNLDVVLTGTLADGTPFQDQVSP